MKTLTWVVLTFGLLAACSKPQSPAEGVKDPKSDHVWKEQTDTLTRAREVDAIVQDSARQQAQAIDEIEDQ